MLMAASYGDANDWRRCFEHLAQSQAEPRASNPAGLTGDRINRTSLLDDASALGLWMNNRYGDALEVLQRTGVDAACGHMADFHILLGMVSRQVSGHDKLARHAYERAIDIDPNRSDAIYNLANLIKDDEQEKADILYRRSLAINPASATTWHNLWF